ncbi:hypothetical protein LIER_09469 [Lithospermum erythrorhizon]|uniref:Retrotransposon gag domain-containing protein n=1 Tax=Lithospermum erythrorhizon TaxID=34254 RepID=A0AAV3PIP7_LITER
MLLEYGSARTASYRPSVVHQTAPPVEPSVALLQELLANQKREFDEFKQTGAGLLTRKSESFCGSCGYAIHRPTQWSAYTREVHFTQYSSIGDPQKHLKGFLAQMTITTNDMDIYAKAFQNSLTGAALDWYMELPPNSIDSYAPTTDAFIAK